MCGQDACVDSASAHAVHALDAHAIFRVTDGGAGNVLALVDRRARLAAVCAGVAVRRVRVLAIAVRVALNAAELVFEADCFRGVTATIRRLFALYALVHVCPATGFGSSTIRVRGALHALLHEAGELLRALAAVWARSIHAFHAGVGLGVTRAEAVLLAIRGGSALDASPAGELTHLSVVSTISISHAVHTGRAYGVARTSRTVLG